MKMSIYRSVYIVYDWIYVWLCLGWGKLLNIQALVDDIAKNRTVNTSKFGQQSVCFGILIYSNVDVLSNGNNSYNLN